jgi:hypothetical protein
VGRTVPRRFSNDPEGNVHRCQSAKGSCGDRLVIKLRGSLLCAAATVAVPASASSVRSHQPLNAADEAQPAA